ncbi:hypothetical protein BJ742DRAFT_804908 [Cladochytrium replicatum]|nr:hypothetical protein BJ742DRAFT_804908 [Cladochytrium replicatum]
MSRSNPRPHAGPAARTSPERTSQEILENILSTPRHSDGTYHCPSCFRTFTRRFNLKTHFASTHCKVREFPCPHCRHAFSRRYDLRRHLRMVHGVQSPAPEPQTIIVVDDDEMTEKATIGGSSTAGTSIGGVSESEELPLGLVQHEATPFTPLQQLPQANVVSTVSSRSSRLPISEIVHETPWTPSLSSSQPESLSTHSQYASSSTALQIAIKKPQQNVMSLDTIVIGGVSRFIPPPLKNVSCVFSFLVSCFRVG